MTPLEARSVLERLADRHRQRLAVAGTVAALAIGALAGPALGHALGASTAWQAVTGVFVLAVGLAGLVARLRLRPVDARAVARHLDQAEPRLQASTELLLAPAGEAGLLDRLQRERVAAAFSALDPALLLPRRGERSLWTVAAMSIVVAIPLLLLGPAPRLALAGTPVA